MRLQHVWDLVKSSAFSFLAHDAKRFQPSFLASFFPLPLFPSYTDEQRACLKKSVKGDLTQFFKLNQLLQDGKTLYSKKSYVFCFSILAVSDGEMTPQDWQQNLNFMAK